MTDSNRERAIQWLNEAYDEDGPTMVGGDMITSLSHILDDAEGRGMERSERRAKFDYTKELWTQLEDSKRTAVALRGQLSIAIEAVDFSQYGTRGMLGAPRGALENAIRAVQAALTQKTEDKGAADFEYAWAYWRSLSEEQRQKWAALQDGAFV